MSILALLSNMQMRSVGSCCVFVWHWVVESVVLKELVLVRVAGIIWCLLRAACISWWLLRASVYLLSACVGV